MHDRYFDEETYINYEKKNKSNENQEKWKGYKSNGVGFKTNCKKSIKREYTK